MTTDPSAAPPTDRRVDEQPQRPAEQQPLRRQRGPRLGWRGGIGACILLAIALGAFLAPLLAPRDPLRLDAAARLQGPSLHHPLGTDQYGRDTLSRLLYGARRSLLVSGAAVLLALLCGGSLGLLAGYYRGLCDLMVMRIVDVLLSFPAILLCIAVLAFLPSDGGARNVVLALGIIFIGPFARTSRAAALSVCRETYVEASRAMGASELRILLRTVLPNAAGPIRVETSVRLAYALLAEASLSFLGLGTQPPAPSWGEMLAEGRRYLLLSPWGAVAPGLVMALTVLGCNLLGDELADAHAQR